MSDRQWKARVDKDFSEFTQEQERLKKTRYDNRRACQIVQLEQMQRKKDMEAREASNERARHLKENPAAVQKFYMSQDVMDIRANSTKNAGRGVAESLKSQRDMEQTLKWERMKRDAERRR